MGLMSSFWGKGLGALGIAGVGYGGYKTLEDYLAAKKQAEADQFNQQYGYPGEVNQDGRPSFVGPMAGYRERSLGKVPADRGTQWGPRPPEFANQYAQMIETGRNILEPKTKQEAVPPTTPTPVPPPVDKPFLAPVPAPIGSGFKSFPVAPPSNFKTDTQPLLTAEQLAALKSFKPVEYGNMDGDLEALKGRFSGIDQRQEASVKDLENRPYQVDLSPVMDLWKSWYGTDFANYKKPETVDERMARVLEIRNRMDEQGAQRQASLFNLKSGLEGRKFDASKFNEEQRIDSEKRGYDVAKDDRTAGQNDRQLDATMNQHRDSLAATLRGQDMQNFSAIRGQNIQSRGQDMDYQTKVAQLAGMKSAKQPMTDSEKFALENAHNMARLAIMGTKGGEGGLSKGDMVTAGVLFQEYAKRMDAVLSQATNPRDATTIADAHIVALKSLKSAADGAKERGEKLGTGAK